MDSILAMHANYHHFRIKQKILMYYITMFLCIYIHVEKISMMGVMNLLVLRYKSYFNGDGFLFSIIFIF